MVVTLRDGTRHTVREVLEFAKKGDLKIDGDLLDKYDDNLCYTHSKTFKDSVDCDIIKVEALTSVYERPTLTEAQQELANLKATVKQAQEQIEKLEGALK